MWANLTGHSNHALRISPHGPSHSGTPTPLRCSISMSGQRNCDGEGRWQTNGTNKGSATPRATSGAARTPYSAMRPEWSGRSEEHTSELQSLMRISYAVFCLKKKNNKKDTHKLHTR